MNAKVSRRAALGVIIAALAAGPFVISSLRKKKPNLSPDEAPYDNTLSVNPDLVQTELSPEELQDALNMVLAEREMWLRFRGVSGTIQVISGKTEADADAAEPACEGFARLTLDNVHLDGDLKVYPFAIKFTFSESKDGEPLIESTLDRNNNIRQTKGENVEGLEPDFVAQLLTTPLEIFAAIPNQAIRDVLSCSLWNVKKDSPDHLVFEPTNESNADGFFAPEMEFDQGHFAKFVSKRMEGQPFTVFTFGSHVESNGFYYPGRIHFTLDPNGNDSVEQTHLTILLSDIEVIVE